MEESVTLPRLLDRQAAKAHLAVLASRESSNSTLWGDLRNSTERERIQALLDLVNGESSEISVGRLNALRAFLEERVAVRERATLMFPPWKKVPHRTVALSMAAEILPSLLNGHVHKVMHFLNAGAGRTIKGRLQKTGQSVDVVLEGPGGELAVTEYVNCDTQESALNYALALVLAKNHGYGVNVCRCHADGCGRFWLLPDKLTGKPSRNFCSLHEADKKRLSDAERKRRQRAQPGLKKRR
jgi:hypothetical protein